jgi:TetR/AcrR family fatty acid metabolism transcriptional regulator
LQTDSADTNDGLGSNIGNGPRPGSDHERTAEIIDRAIQIFAKQGYYNTKMRDIAENLGCSVGTIYIYFSSRKQLLLAAVDSVIAMMIERASNVDESVADPIEGAKAKGLFFTESAGHVRDIMSLLQAEAIGEDVEFSRKTKELFSKYASLVAKDLALAVEEKYIRDTNTEIISYCLLGMAWMLGSRLDQNDGFSGKELIEVAADALVNGLLSRSLQVESETELV